MNEHEQIPKLLTVFFQSNLSDQMHRKRNTGKKRRKELF